MPYQDHYRVISAKRLARLHERELARFTARTRQSRALLERGRNSMVKGVPMSWMHGLYRHPSLFVDSGAGSGFRDVDGNRYIDFNVVGPGEVLGMFQQLETWFNRFRDTAMLGGFNLPFTQAVLGDLLAFDSLVKEELLIEELADLQEDAWLQFREGDDRKLGTRKRVRRFLDVQHELLMADADLTRIALRATTRPEAPVAKRVLALHDRTIGLLFEILQMGVMSKDLVRGVDALEAARTVFHITLGARIPWANEMVNADACRQSIQKGVDQLFDGIGAPARKD